MDIYALAGDPDAPTRGQLVANLVNFARALRAAGLPIGPGRVIEAVRAVEAAGLRRRDDFYWTLFSVFVNRRDQREIFDQAFHIFWRNPKLLEKMLGLLLPQVDGGEPSKKTELSRRLQEAISPGQGEAPEADKEPPELEVEATLTWNDREILQKKDFEQMSATEIARALRAISRLRLPIDEVATRRHRQSIRGRKVDLRATLRRSMRPGGLLNLRWRQPRTRRPPLVILCDVSGSMSKYSRMFLHFMHAIANDRDRVHCFTFGTRLTNVTRALRAKDVDLALAKAGAQVADWSGGTRIGATLHEFNRHWSRRVLGQGAVVVLLTDGLDRDGAAGLGEEMERLHKSCRRLIWLNPLLRWDGYEPKSQGNRAMMPHVDEFRAAHSLDSLEDLVAALGAEGGPRGVMTDWRARARAA